jgi:hypothetical protein
MTATKMMQHRDDVQIWTGMTFRLVIPGQQLHEIRRRHPNQSTYRRMKFAAELDCRVGRPGKVHLTKIPLSPDMPCILWCIHLVSVVDVCSERKRDIRFLTFSPRW